MPYKNIEDKRRYQNAWVKKNRNKHKSITKRLAARKREWLRIVKASRCCVECGENHPACLDFHHRNAKSKLFNIGSAVTIGYSTERIQSEIAKCDVLCSNCHRKLHWRVVEVSNS